VVNYSYVVQPNTAFRFWGLGGNTSGPASASQQTVTVNGTVLNWNSSWGRHSFTTPWNSTEQAFIYSVTITGDTDIVIDCGTRDIWACGDESYTSAPVTTGSGSAPFRLDESGGWVWYWLNQSGTVYSNYSVTNIEEHLSDGTVVANYPGFEAPVIGALTQTATSPAQYALTITNVRRTSVQLIKIDETTRHSGTQRALSGASFRLLKYEGSAYAAYAENGYGAPEGVPVGTDGTLTFSELPAGRYQIIETNPPQDYVKAVNNDIFFDIVDGVVHRYDRAYGEAGRTEIPQDDVISAISLEQRSGGPAFVVGNSPGAVLPSTGGGGTALYPVLGGLAMLFSGAMLLRRRKREE
jgi:LPXTG-motif cell wall-anchored protein